MDHSDRRGSNDNDSGPALEERDWEAVGGDEVSPEEIAENGDFRYDGDEDELPEEDDDNAYQESDEALPDDAEERALDRDPSKEGSRFDEI